MNAAKTLEEVTSALRKQTRVAFDDHHIELALSADGELTLSGSVRDLAAKRIAARTAAQVPGVARVLDLLTVPAAPRGDGAIRVNVRDELLVEPALLECTITERAKGRTEIVRSVATGRGLIDIEVDSGTVWLRGVVPGLAHRRLAVSIAWHVPGVRNVVDLLDVSPPEVDHDGEIADALLLVLEKVRIVDPAAIQIHVEDAVIRLRGWVQTAGERDAIVRAAWTVEGVRDVVGQLRIAPERGARAPGP